METQTADDCELCDEVRLAGTAVTGHDSKDGITPGFSRLVKRTSVVDVIVGLGCLVPGYLLLVPQRHVRSTGELSPVELARLFDVGWSMAEEVERLFGVSAVLVEHGSSGPADRRGSACIVHGHIHVFPIPATLDDHAFRLADGVPVRGVGALQDAAQHVHNYYYCASTPDNGSIWLDPDISSQFARRAWASLLGVPDVWDWAAFPYLENVQLTVDRLRSGRTQPPVKQLGRVSGYSWLLETIDAYDVSAPAYAERTQSFGTSSTLPSEMTALLEQTRGVVLDAGAGGGRDARFMAALGRPVVAVDASVKLLSTWQRSDGVARVAADIRMLPLGGASVGAIWCSAVLLHLDAHNVRSALYEFRRVLKPGGLAQISVKEGRGHVSKPINIAPGLGLRRHFFYYDTGDMQQMALHAGFEVVGTWTEDEADSADIVQQWVKLLLRRPST